MNASVINKRKDELVSVLKYVPHCKKVKTIEHLEMLNVLLKQFQLEMEWNISQHQSYSFSLDYLSQLIYEFKTLYMVIEGTFDVIIFPEIIQTVASKRLCRLKTYPDINKFVYLRIIALLEKRESDIRKRIKYNVPISEVVLKTEPNNRYKLKEKSIINIIELGYFLYTHGNIIYRNGDEIQLVPFIKDIGQFVGEDIKNIHQRIDEMKNRSIPHKYLDFLIKNYSPVND